MPVLYEGRGEPMAGYISAGGVIRTINVSNLSIAEVFLREAVQNSFDAKKEDSKNINFGMRAYNFTDEQLSNFKNLFDEGTSLKPTFYKKYLASKIKKNMLNIEVTDTNTIGLTGFPGVTNKNDNTQHFYKFVYVTGNDKGNDSNAGGSYGFGKAAFYSFSKLRTICIYSRIKSNAIKNGKDVYQSRFIIATIDERITDTLCDRCWWGKEAKYNDNPASYAAPLLDNEADEIANSIGLRKFDETETGTKLLILDAGIEENKLSFENENEVKGIDHIFINDIPRYIVHWYWPKIIKEEIIFSLEYKGKKIEIDNPYDIYPYSEFAIAFEEGRKKYIDKRIQEANGYKRVCMKRPAAELGYVSVKKSQVTVGRKCEYRDLFKEFETPIPSVAFMRGIGHIVFYKHYNNYVDPSLMKETCFGIFKVNKSSCTENGTPGEIDRYFRDIEDQTHERWVHKKDKGPNFLGRVEQDVEDVIKRTVSIEEDPENAVANLSVVIQRTLGSKLMLSPNTYGGAKKPLKDDAFAENSIAVKKSTFKPTGKQKVEIDLRTGEKIIEVEYKASIKKDKVLNIREITPLIKDADGNKIQTSDLIFKKVNLMKKSSNGISRLSLTRLPLKIASSGDYTVSIICKKDCAFTVDITAEEE